MKLCGHELEISTQALDRGDDRLLGANDSTEGVDKLFAVNREAQEFDEYFQGRPTWPAIAFAGNADNEWCGGCRRRVENSRVVIAHREQHRIVSGITLLLGAGSDEQFEGSGHIIGLIPLRGRGHRVGRPANSSDHAKNTIARRGCRHADIPYSGNTTRWVPQELFSADLKWEISSPNDYHARVVVDVTKH